VSEQLFRETTDNDRRVDALLMVFIRVLYENKYTSVSKEDLRRVLPFYIFFIRYISGASFEIPQMYEKEESIQGTLSEGAVSGIFHTRGPRNDGRYHFNNGQIARHLTKLFVESILTNEELEIAVKAAKSCVSAYGRKLKWGDTDPFKL
jgi:hypothetical protein